MAGETSSTATAGGGMEMVDSTSTEGVKSGLATLSKESKVSGKSLSSSKEKPGHSVSPPVPSSTGSLLFLAT